MRVAGRFEDAAAGLHLRVAWPGHAEHVASCLAWPGLAWPNMLDMARHGSTGCDGCGRQGVNTPRMTMRCLLQQQLQRGGGAAGQLEWEQQLAAYLSIFMCACTPWGMQRAQCVCNVQRATCSAASCKFSWLGKLKRRRPRRQPKPGPGERPGLMSFSSPSRDTNRVQFGPVPHPLALLSFPSLPLSLSRSLSTCVSVFC